MQTEKQLQEALQALARLVHPAADDTDVDNARDVLASHGIGVVPAARRPYDFTRVNNDVNGNPRYVVHFLAFKPETAELGTFTYDAALALARRIGGRKFHNKQYGGGIVFQSYCTDELAAAIDRVRAS